MEGPEQYDIYMHGAGPRNPCSLTCSAPSPDIYIYIYIHTYIYIYNLYIHMFIDMYTYKVVSLSQDALALLEGVAAGNLIINHVI
jgi:hypothetical protein